MLNSYYFSICCFIYFITFCNHHHHHFFWGGRGGVHFDRFYVFMKQCFMFINLYSLFLYCCYCLLFFKKILFSILLFISFLFFFIFLFFVSFVYLFAYLLLLNYYFSLGFVKKASFYCLMHRFTVAINGLMISTLAVSKIYVFLS